MLNASCGRLWHQLTNKLFEFFDYPLTRPYRVDVFNKFVRDFESKLNQLRVVEMGVKVSKEIDSEYSSALGCTLGSWMGTLVRDCCWCPDRVCEARVALSSSVRSFFVVF